MEPWEKKFSFEKTNYQTVSQMINLFEDMMNEDVSYCFPCHVPLNDLNIDDGYLEGIITAMGNPNWETDEFNDTHCRKKLNDDEIKTLLAFVEFLLSIPEEHRLKGEYQ